MNWGAIGAVGEMLATSPDLADVVAKGNGLADLGDAEALRYGAFVQSFLDNVEAYRSLSTDHGVGVLE
jgi:hypothetical protein